jgi:hypothetical protein
VTKLSYVRGARVRQLTTIALATALISLAAAWAPAPAPDRALDRPAAASRVADLAGVYVLQRASGARPPIPFEMNMAGGALAGTVDGARVVLASDGSYTNDVVVTWTKTPMLPIPGLEADGKPHTLAGSGTYKVDGAKVILRPADMFSRGVVRSVEASAGEKGLDLLSASGGLAGSSVSINAHFVRIRD